jgi:teichuronic acid biosynthesis glycosyltransferase TuaC
MKALFVSSGNNPSFRVAPFIASQELSLQREGVITDHYAITGKGLRGYLGHIRPLRRRIRQGNYDVIHAHYSFCGWIARMAAPGKPLVVSLMGSDTYGSVNQRGRMRMKSIPMMLQSIMLNFFANALIVKSPNLMRYVILKKRAFLIPNGVDFDLFRPLPQKETRKQLGLEPTAHYALFPANPADSRKNYRMAEQSVALCQVPGITLLAPYPVKHEEMPMWYNAADVLISTSWLEGSPNVIKEAMACNCPVVATPAGDTTDLLKGVLNCRVAPWKPEEIAKAINMVVSTAHRSDAREQRDDLDSRVIAQKIIEVYQKIAKRSL